MPSYTFTCLKCGDTEVFMTFKEYKPKIKCPTCRRQIERNLLADASSVIATGVDGPTTLGSIADKNADKMSEDKKEALRKKHYEYREGEPTKPLPKGMSRIEKPEERIRWT